MDLTAAEDDVPLGLWMKWMTVMEILLPSFEVVYITYTEKISRCRKEEKQFNK